MANVKTTNVAIKDSISLFLQHWVRGHNYEDSTILVDPSYNIIAFFDHKTENIDVIMADIPFQWGYIISNWKPIEVKDWKNIKYKPYDYESARFKYKERLKEIRKRKGSIKWVWEEMLKELKDYNVNYFDNIIIEND